MITFQIKGTIKEEETGLPLTGLSVKAYDKDLFFDDLLGTASTNHEGRFEIVSDVSDFREFLEKRPDIYLKIMRDGTLVHDTKDAIRWNAGRVTDLEVRIPASAVREPRSTRIVATAEDGREREEFDVGESLSVHVRDLRPAHVHEVRVELDGRELFTNRYITDRHGTLPPTVVLPQVGLDDPTGEARPTVDEAFQRWRGRRITLTVLDGERVVAEQTVRVSKKRTQPIVVSTDTDGRLLNGFEAGTRPLHLTLRALPSGGPTRVYMVHRQHDWRVGDAFRVATLADGRPAVREFDLPTDGGTVRFAEADELREGPYDFIVRPIRYGREEDEVLHVQARDVVGGRLTTGVVVRSDFWLGKPVQGGCVNKIPISGQALGQVPYYRYRDTFAVGEDVWAGFDPGIVDPDNVSKRCALYVVPNRDEAGWSADNSLQHLAVLGGNPGVLKHTVQGTCMNANKVLVWPDASQVGEYDIVVDFGNNTSNAAAFDEDHKYETPLDMIDGYFLPGFRVVEDAGTKQDFAHFGVADYTAADVDAMGLTGTVTVQDETGPYEFETPILSDRTLPLQAHVRFPADTAGVTGPSQISTVETAYPTVVIVHGQGHNYEDYDFVLEHLARNGFIAASIHLADQMRGLGRANVLFKHLQVLQTRFGASMQNNVGIMGHSRGGEGVVKAARINQQDGLGHNLNAVLSLAPTNQYGREAIEGTWATPYFILYGSRDGDVSGYTDPSWSVPPCPFPLYDRSTGAEKSMVFVYRATHNGFITTNYDADDAVVLDIPSQKAVTLAYANAFFRQHLRNEPQWGGMFTGAWKPPSVEQAGVELYVQYRDPTPADRVVDDFEQTPSDWTDSTIGPAGSVSHTGLPADPQEGKAHHISTHPGLDPRSPHDTRLIRFRWDSSNDRVDFDIPAGQRDLSNHRFLSLRVTQVEGSPHNAVGQPQDFRLALRDGAGQERAVRVGLFGTVPYPDQRAWAAVRKSALTTLRIPLTAYTIVCSNAQEVDLTDVVRLSLVFNVPGKSTGEIEVDSIEFTD